MICAVYMDAQLSTYLGINLLSAFCQVENTQMVLQDDDVGFEVTISKMRPVDLKDSD